MYKNDKAKAGIKPESGMPMGRFWIVEASKKLPWKL